jgi:hypothetical protein
MMLQHPVPALTKITQGPNFKNQQLTPDQGNNRSVVWEMQETHQYIILVTDQLNAPILVL